MPCRVRVSPLPFKSCLEAAALFGQVDAMPRPLELQAPSRPVSAPRSRPASAGAYVQMRHAEAAQVGPSAFGSLESKTSRFEIPIKGFKRRFLSRQGDSKGSKARPSPDTRCSP